VYWLVIFTGRPDNNTLRSTCAPTCAPTCAWAPGPYLELRPRRGRVAVREGGVRRSHGRNTFPRWRSDVARVTMRMGCEWTGRSQQHTHTHCVEETPWRDNNSGYRGRQTDRPECFPPLFWKAKRRETTRHFKQNDIFDYLVIYLFLYLFLYLFVEVTFPKWMEWQEACVHSRTFEMKTNLGWVLN